MERKITIDLKSLAYVIGEVFIIWLCFHFHKVHGAENDTIHPDTLMTNDCEQRISAVEQELHEIQENNRFCSIIGAYTIINVSVTKPTKENVADLVAICDCWYPDIIMAQYQLESSFGTSPVAKKNHNLFGMKKAWTRKSVRCRAFDKAGYAIYNNWQLSVIDRIFWEEYEFHNKKPTRAEYLAKIKRIYAEDANYIAKIERISAEYREYFGIE